MKNRKFLQRIWLDARPHGRKVSSPSRGLKFYRPALFLQGNIRFLGSGRAAQTALKAMMYAQAVQFRYARMIGMVEYLDSKACEFCGAWPRDDKCWRRQLARLKEWARVAWQMERGKWLSNS